MADLSQIPLTRHDFKVYKTNDQPRMRDMRFAQRLGYNERLDRLRELIKTYQQRLERLDTLPFRTAKSTGGRPANEYLLTLRQAFFIAAKSAAANVDDVLSELSIIGAARYTGDDIPADATPILDKIAAPQDRPTVSRREDNVVHIEHEEWTQPELFALSSPSIGDAHLNAIAGPPSKPGGFNEVEWHDYEADVEYSVIKSVRRNGAPMSLFFSRIGISHVATEAVFWVPDPSGNGDQVGLYLNHVIPLAVVERAVDRLGIGPMSQLTHNTLRHYLAF